MSSNDDWQSGRTLSEGARFMLDNQIATDVTFKFRNTDEVVKAHRFVLMVRSHVFYIMFNSVLDKPGEAIEISDIEPAMFKEFLRYLYSDSDETTLSAEKALHLIYCAEKYEVTDLKTLCIHFLQTQVDKETVAIILDHAVLYNDDALITTCRDIIKPQETLSCLEKHHISKDTLAMVLGIEGLCVGEVDIFKFCNTWAENESKRMNIPVNASNRRKMLGPLIRKMPFCSMTNKEFATEVSGKHLLNGQEELQIFRYIGATDKSNPPFPCKPKGGTEAPIIRVKLPLHATEFQTQGWTLDEFSKKNHLMNSDSEVFTVTHSTFKLSISCSKSFKLLALEFRQPGDYALLFDGVFLENFSVHENNLKGFLKTRVQCDVGQHVTIHSIHPSQRQFTRFPQVRQVKGLAGHIELNITVHEQTPFDMLILQLELKDLL